MEQLIYEVNGVKYLLFSAKLSSELQSRKFVDRIKDHKGIIQSMDQDYGFLFLTVRVRVLIPEHLACQFSGSHV
jgi:hypothetical protein